MIFDRAIRREFVQSASGISIVLLAILLSTQLIRFLNEAAAGRVAPEAVVVLLGFATLQFLPIVLTLTLFVAVLLSLSRVYRDAEMVVWLSCGQPLTAWIRPALRFALPFIACIALLSLVLSPWASRMADTYRLQLSVRSELSQVTPGVFREVKRGQRVFFVEEMTEDATEIGNIFVADVQDGKMGVIVSATGFQETLPNGERFIVLRDGRRYQVEPGSAAFKISEFSQYKLRTQDGRAEQNHYKTSRLSLEDLLAQKSSSAYGELAWRFGMPLSALILVLMAIPLSHVNPRAGRSANLLIAVLVYAIYNNLLSVGQAWIGQNKLSLLSGMLLTHAVMFVPLLFMFWRQISVRRWRGWNALVNRKRPT